MRQGEKEREKERARAREAEKEREREREAERERERKRETEKKPEAGMTLSSVRSHVPPPRSYTSTCPDDPAPSAPGPPQKSIP